MTFLKNKALNFGKPLTFCLIGAITFLFVASPALAQTVAPT